MAESRLPRAREIRGQLAFDVERLRSAVARVEGIDGTLSSLKTKLVARARTLATEAASDVVMSGDGTVQLRRAQAQAIASIASRAALGEVLAASSRLSLVTAMAVSRWVGALRALSPRPASEVVLRSHIEAGRVAHRLLSIFRPKDQLRSGVGQLVASVVVAELAHADDIVAVDEQLEEGLHRARNARGVRTDDDAIAAASRALRSAAKLLEELADEAEPAARALVAEADTVETRVAGVFDAAVRGRG